MGTTIVRSFDIPFKKRVALDLVPNWTAFDAFGSNPQFSNTAEDLWVLGGVRTLPTSAAVVAISSSDVNDDGSPAGTGVQTVLIEGLDSNYAEINETITMNGTTVVNTAASFFRINRMTAMAVGSNGSAVGDITASIGGNNQARIGAGLNRTKLSQHTIPEGQTALLERFFANSGNNDDVAHSLQIRSENGPWLVVRELETIGEHIAIQLAGTISIAARSEIRIQVTKQSAGNANAAGGYDLLKTTII